MLKVIYDDIRKYDEKYFLNLYQKSGSNLKQRIDRLVRSDRKKESLLGIDLLCRILKTDKADIKYDDRGKPYLCNSSLNFSISHSKGLVACVVSDARVGIDIELIRKANTDRDLILNDLASDDEQKLLIHVIKEAYVKMLGQGIFSALDMKLTINNQNITIEGVELIVEIINGTHIMVIAEEKDNKKPITSNMTGY